MTGKNSPQGIGTATMCWRHKDGTIHESILHDALDYLDSPVSAVRVTKLVQGTKVRKMIIQTFDHHLVLAYDHSSH